MKLMTHNEAFVNRLVILTSACIAVLVHILVDEFISRNMVDVLQTCVNILPVQLLNLTFSFSVKLNV